MSIKSVMRNCLTLIVTLAITLCLIPESKALEADYCRQLELEGKSWIPKATVKLRGIVVCLHGFGLNANSYEYFAKRLTEDGFAVYALDARGFGNWRTKNKHPKLDLSTTVEDTNKLLGCLRAKFSSVTIFLLGESMGGAVALTTVAKYPSVADAVIASVPAAERFDQKKSVLAVGTRLLFAPNKEFDLSEKVVNKALSDEEVRQRWLTQPKNRLHLSAKELFQFQSFMKNATKLARKIETTPVLIVQGCKDNLVKPRASVRLYNSIACHEKKLLLVGQAEHLIFQKGLIKEQTYQMVLAWLISHAPEKNR